MSGIKDARVSMLSSERDRLINNARRAEESAEQMRQRERAAQRATDVANMKVDALNRTLNTEITGLQSDMRDMANDQNRRLREQAAEQNRLLQEQGAAFNNSIADVNKRMEAQRIALNKSVDEVRQQTENNRRELQKSIDSINARIDEKEKKSKELADRWVGQARAYFDDISRYKRHDLFARGELEKLKGTLDLVISSKIDESIVSTGIMVFQDAVSLKEKVAIAEIEWTGLHTILQKALADTKSNLSYRQTMQFTFSTEEGEEAVDAEIDYWTNNELGRIEEKLSQIEKGAAQPDRLSIDELNKMIEELKHINGDIELAEDKAKEAFISSQTRGEMASSLIEMLMDHGWTCKDGDCAYEGGEHNGKVHVKLSDIKHNEIVAVITPDKDMANNIEIHFFNKDNDEGFRKTQLKSITESLEEIGLDVGEPVCRKGYESRISGNEAIRDVQATAARKVQAAAAKTAQATRY
jgi:hypothetical protein